MKIGPIDTKPPTPVGTERKQGAHGVQKGPATPAPSAEVALSAAATSLTEGSADPAFDSAKVERIAGAIRDGKFKVNAEAIADKLIVNAEELLGRKFS
jgi:negative regulator of flagellin synthesis FlgM